MRRWLGVLAGLTVCSCFQTTIRSGNPPASVAKQHDEAWHSGYLLGVVEASGPYDLAEACPGGWAEIETELQPLQTLAMIVTLGIYSPQTETVVCRDLRAPALPPLEGAEGAPAVPPLPTVGPI